MRLWSVLLLGLISLVFLGILTPFFELSTTVKFSNSEAGLTWRVEGTTLQSTGFLANVKKIEILASSTPFPIGAKYLRINGVAGTSFEAKLPRNFSQPEGHERLVGDWWVDKPREFSAYQSALDLSGAFELEAEFIGRSLQATKIVLSGDKVVSLEFRRGFINHDVFIKVNDQVIANGGLQVPVGSSILGILGQFLPSVLVSVSILLIFILGTYFLSSSRKVDMLQISPQIPTGALHKFEKSTLFLLCAFGFLLFVWAAARILEGLPHFQDDLCYLLRAKWLTAGKFYEIKPNFAANIELPYTYFKDDKWMAVYPIGWPLILSIGEIFGIPWIMAPLCATLSIYFLWLLTREIYGRKTAFVAVVLFILSPMSLILFGSMLSHAITTLMVLMHLYFLMSALKRKGNWRFLVSGAALAYSFGTRPLTAVAIGAAISIYLMLILYLRRKEWLPLCKGYAFMAIGGLIGLTPILLDNLIVTGNPLLFAYAEGAGAKISFDTVGEGLIIADSTLSLIHTLVFGWGWGISSTWFIRYLTYAFAFMPFFVGQAKLFDWLMALLFIAVPFAYVGYPADGAHGYGPRYYAEVFICLYILTARGLMLLLMLDLSKVGTGWRVKFRDRSLMQIFSGTNTMMSLGIFAILTISTVFMLSARLDTYRGYNGINGALERQIRENNIKEGIILLNSWYEFAQAGNFLPANLRESRLVFATKLENNRPFFEAYPGLPKLWWQGEKLIPYEEGH